MKAPKMQALISFSIGCPKEHMFLNMHYLLRSRETSVTGLLLFNACTHPSLAVIVRGYGLMWRSDFFNSKSNANPEEFCCQTEHFRCHPELVEGRIVGIFAFNCSTFMLLF